MDGQLRFTSTQHDPVLKETAAEPLAVLLQSVGQTAAPEADRLLDKCAGLGKPAAPFVEQGRQLDRAGRPFTSSANQLLRPIAQLDRIDMP